MFTRLFVFLMLLSSAVSAQSNATVNRLLVKDSMSIGGHWIKEIKSDSTMWGTHEGTISTDGAWKNHILNTARNSPLNPVPGPPRDSALTIDPVTGKLAISALKRFTIQQSAALHRNPWLKVAMNPMLSVMRDVIPEDSLQFECTSSDGVKTTISFHGGYPDWNYAKGNPPYTIKADWVNRYPDKFILLNANAVFWGDNGRSPINSLFAAYKDTIHFRQQFISNSISFDIHLMDSVPNGVIMPVTVRNNTRDMIILSVPTGTNTIFPNEDISIKVWYTQPMQIRCQGVVRSANAEIFFSNVVKRAYRGRVYENGILTNTTEMRNYPGMVIPITNPLAQIELVVEYL
ncbi:hypothetical protein ACE38W_04070 [Chitinophaga sp. Hz27]|uniref:hypothetical protein n=1 Tax=Chitinophaga sp. Hz27 TaxID=3347169 RepID=UPI0035D8A751